MDYNRSLISLSIIFPFLSPTAIYSLPFFEGHSAATTMIFSSRELELFIGVDYDEILEFIKFDDAVLAGVDQLHHCDQFVFFDTYPKFGKQAG